MNPKLRRIVVVGNGIAGLTAGDSLRSAGFDGELTIIGDEHHAPYSRPALSKAALLDAGEELSSHLLPPPDHAATELLGVTATRLDPERRLVHLSDGNEVPYDGAVIATGSRARRVGASSQLVLRSLDDALELRRRLKHRPKVVVIGGGPLGMEIASGSLASGSEVTLAPLERPLSEHLGNHLSDIFIAAALERGLTIAPHHATEIRDDSVVLADGTVLEAELIVCAVGDIPNVEWLADSGLLAGGRLEVDTRGRLRPDIVAAGDVAFLPTKHGLRRMPLWTSAIEQSKAAALALLRGGEAPELDFQPYFWTEQFGLSLKASGHLPADGDPEYLEGDAATLPSLMRWGRSATAVAINYRIPIPKLRRLSQAAPDPSRETPPVTA